MRKIRTLLLLLLYPLSACSVKEDRDPCPCLLYVSFPAEKPWGQALVNANLQEEDGRVSNHAISVPDCPGEWTHSVRKGEVLLSCHTNLSGSPAGGEELLLPPGNEADSLYAYWARLDCRMEEQHVSVRFLKQFCTVRLSVSQTAEQLQAYRFEVSGNSCGINLRNGESIPGEFRCRPRAKSGSATVDFRLFRQADDALQITIWHNDGGQDTRVGTFPIGRYIRETGYDWAAKELPDIFLKIDLVQNSINIRPADWEEGATYRLIEQ